MSCHSTLAELQAALSLQVLSQTVDAAALAARPIYNTINAIYIYICMYVCMYVYMYIYIYIYILREREREYDMITYDII